MQGMRSPKNLYNEAELTGDLMRSLYLAATPAKLFNDWADVAALSALRVHDGQSKQTGGMDHEGRELERHSAKCPVKVGVPAITNARHQPDCFLSQRHAADQHRV
jgi:hypothetical protein